MRVHQHLWLQGQPMLQSPAESAQLLLVFADAARLRDPALSQALENGWPGVPSIGCSTAGEIHDTRVHEGSVSITAISFDRTPFRIAVEEVRERGDSRAVGRVIAERLAAPDLAGIFVLSDGLIVNGSELVLGLSSALPVGLPLTGGLSGDGARFQQTLLLAEGEVRGGRVAAVGFYGDHIRIGCGSRGGWDLFGPTRVITRSEGSILHELDGEAALDAYRRYLGHHAADLPASALRFPLSLDIPGHSQGIVRTVLGVDASTGSMTFAGDMPVGARARFMHANFERLIDGAQAAAGVCGPSIREPAELAILISCVGRKLVLGQRTEEEVEGVRDVLGPTTPISGFYSYGEISPFTPGAACELHNQTMTITTFAEAA